MAIFDRWAWAKLSWAFGLLMLTVTAAGGSPLSLTDPLGIPPALMLSLIGIVFAGGMAWGDIKRRITDMESDIKAIKNRHDDEEWGENGRRD